MPDFFPHSISDMGKIIQLNHQGVFLLVVFVLLGFFERELSNWLKAQRFKVSKCISAAVWVESFQLWILTG